MPSIQQLMRLIEGLPVFYVDDKLDKIIEQNSELLELGYQINRTLQTFIRKDNQDEENTMSQMSDLVAKLQTEVASIPSIKQGFETVIASLKQQLTDAIANAQNSGDLTALQAAVDGMDSNLKDLSNSLTANTPAASEPPVTAPVTPVTVDTPATDSSTTPAASTPDNSSAPAATPTAPDAAAAVPADSSTPAAAPDNSAPASAAPASTDAPATDAPQSAEATPNTPSNS